MAPTQCIATPSFASGIARCGTPRMGFAPSPKELSNDPPIAEVIRMVKAEQVARFARASMDGPTMLKSLPGAGPFGIFDPLKLTPESADEALLWREAELVHGRVSMMAALGFIVQEQFHPLFSFADGPVIHQFDEVLTTPDGLTGGSLLLMATALSELQRARVGWVDPDRELRTLRKDYEPGAVGFDPLAFKKKLSEDQYVLMQNKELNNGRLAMIGVAGMTAQELVTNAPLFA